MEVICRIRPPQIKENITRTRSGSWNSKAPTFQASQKLDKSNQSTLKLLQKSSSANLNEICIFTPSQELNSKMVVYSEVPIKQKLIKEFVKSQDDVATFQDNILQNSVKFEFDGAYKPEISNLTIYSDKIKQKAANLMNGVSSSIILAGASQSGKMYTLKGLETTKEQGILIHAVEDILALMEISNKHTNKLNLYCQMFFVDGKNVCDLLSAQKLFVEVPQVSLNKVKTIKEFKSYYIHARNRHQSLGNRKGDLNLSQKSHFIISVVIKTSLHPSYDDTIYSKMNFIKLADYNNNSQKLVSDFNELQELLLFFKTHKMHQKDYLKKKYFSTIVRELINYKDEILLICNVEPTSQDLQNSKKILEFGSRLVFDCNDEYNECELNSMDSSIQLGSNEKQIDNQKQILLVKDQLTYLKESILDLKNRSKTNDYQVSEINEKLQSISALQKSIQYIFVESHETDQIYNRLKKFKKILQSILESYEKKGEKLLSPNTKKLHIIDSLINSQKQTNDVFMKSQQNKQSHELCESSTDEIDRQDDEALIKVQNRKNYYKLKLDQLNKKFLLLLNPHKEERIFKLFEEIEKLQGQQLEDFQKLQDFQQEFNYLQSVKEEYQRINLQCQDQNIQIQDLQQQNNQYRQIQEEMNETKRKQQLAEDKLQKEMDRIKLITKFEKENSELKENNQILEKKILKMKSKANKEKENLQSDLTQKLQKKKSKIQNFKQQFISQNQKITELHKNIEEMKNSIENCKLNYDNLQKELDITKNHKRVLEEKNLILNKELIQIKENIRNESQELIELKEKSAIQIKENKKLRKMVTSLENDAENYDKDNEKIKLLHNELQDLKEINRKLHQQEKELSDENKRLKRQNDESNDALNSIQQQQTKQLDFLEQKLDSVCYEVKKKNDENQQLLQRLQEASRENQKINEDFKRLKFENVELRDDLLKLQDHIDKIENEFRNINNEVHHFRHNEQISFNSGDPMSVRTTSLRKNIKNIGDELENCLKKLDY